MRKLSSMLRKSEETLPSRGGIRHGRYLHLRLRLDVIQRLIHRQPRDHHHLRDTQRGFSVRGLQYGGEVVEHFTGGIEGLAGVGQQGFAVVGGVGQEHGVVFGVAAHDALLRGEVMVEGAFGGFVEFFGIWELIR